MPLATNISSHSFPVISGYHLVEQLYLGSRTVVYRALQTTTQRPVVIKVLRCEYPSFSELVQFRNQYAILRCLADVIAKNFPIPGIIQPLSLEPLGSGYALVMEDWGGVALSQYLQQSPLNLPEVLEIAVQLADILHDLSQHRVVHKDIKPANILIQPESKQVKLIDFSIASLLHKETPEIQSPNVLEGTLAYLAPEQTGRMNRGIDYRADFYALGITLYQLFTGALPFQSDDPLELVHCHLSKTAVPVDQLNSTVPSMVAAIVTKLMAKNAEDRYQSAMGIKHDLQQCLSQWKETGAIAEFKLGEWDLSDRFLIPEKLYGREAEVQTLLEAFDRVASGASELMLVAGFSGIGKTAVVNEVHKPITRQQGYFIKGKFDQFNRNIPLSAFVLALRDLMKQLLSESDIQLHQWKTEILAALGENGQVLIEVIPELEQVIGQQPPAPELSGSAAQNRFNLLFQKFIEVFTTADHPLVIFLDDLQWSDSASLQLMKLLMNDNGYLLMLGAYRDNEVSPAHPFMMTVDELQKTQVTVNTVMLAPLTFVDTNHLVADTLNCAEQLAQPLTELIDRKTKGNPFFTTQFLKALHEENYITFNQHLRYWECDIAQVNALSLTDDVVEFMALQLQKLPEETQSVLKLAACIGNQFDLNTLTIVSEQSATDAATALWKALQEGLILPTSQVYKFFQDGQTEAKTTANPSYRFLHDRVQQAAYSLIFEDQQQFTHLKIGQALLSHVSSIQLEENIFTIVNQFNLGIAHISVDQQVQLIDLNLKAGRKARLSSAYEAAEQYCKTALSLLLPDAWIQNPQRSLDLYREAAMTAFLTGQYEQVDQRIAVILQQTHQVLDQVQAIEIQIQSLVARNQIGEAIKSARRILQALGVELPEEPTPELISSALALLQEQLNAIEAITELPPMQEREKLAAMNILSSMASAAYIGSPNLYPLVVLKQIEISLQFGYSEETAYAFSTYGLILSAFNNEILAGNYAADIALLLLDRSSDQLNGSRFTAKVLNLVYPFVRVWRDPLQTGLEPLLTGYQAGLESGDLEFAAYCAFNHCQLAFFAGVHLDEVRYKMQTYHQAIAAIKQSTALNFHQIGYQSVLNWIEESNEPYLLSGPIYQETERFLDHQAAGDQYSVATAYVHKLILSYHFAEPQIALDMAKAAEAKIGAIAGTVKLGAFHFYYALTLLTNHTENSETITQQLEKLQAWTIHSPITFSHKCDLIRAEQYRQLGQKSEAIDLYDRAISGAKANGYIQEEALANELAAKFYLAWGKEKVAAGYMQEAYYGYAHWGAKAKTDDLEKRYPNLLRPILEKVQGYSPIETLATIAAPTFSIHATVQTSRSTSISSVNSTLDFAAILKASQSLSSTIQLDELLHQLTQIILQNSGADRCALMLPNAESVWEVRSIATPEETQICQTLLQGNPDVPTKLIYYVKNTQEAVIIDDCETDLSVIGEYLSQHYPKSVLCLPILNQGNLIGILYLQNRLTSGVFTNDRILILNFLCTQAAISLENSRLFCNLQQREKEIIDVKFALDQSAIVAVTNRSGLIQYVNDKFCELSQYSKDELIGKTHSLLNSQSHDTGFFRAMWKTITNGTIWRGEICNRTKHGAIYWVDTTIVPFLDNQGKPYQYIAIRHDITPRKIAELEAQQSNQNLNETLIQLQQSQAQVVQSEKMSALGNLVAGVAHEINNPIGFLNGSINNGKEFLQDLLGHLALYQQHYPNPVAAIQDHAEDVDLEYLCEDFPKLLDSMKGATDRIKGISTSLRTFSRADTEYKVQANLHDGIDSTILILKYRLKANEFRPAIDIIQNYDDIPAIDCFPGQLNQVFMNILANAIDMFDEMAQLSSFEQLKANPQQIMIQTALTNNIVEISIRDNGKGMTEEVKAKVFDHLFTTKGVGKGTGLGLAIARQIVVETHGGTLDVRSDLGQGTEFCIRLPSAG